MNGDIAVTTIAADIAASLGVLVVTAAGNSGPSVSTLAAPGDGDSVLTCGAVASDSSVASFSSRGPTADGRIKPDVSALGVSTRCARGGSDFEFGYANGTSLSTPLIAGACALILQAHPTWSPMKVIEALRDNSSFSHSPNSNIGWGVPDIDRVIHTFGDTLLISFYSGWNMFSNPFDTPLELTPASLPGMMGEAWWFNPEERAYEIVTSLEPAQTVFISFGSDSMFTLYGSALEEVNIVMYPGWNMVGSIGRPSSESEYSVVPAGSYFIGNVYRYDTIDRVYTRNTDLIPGEGRWFLVSSPCTLEIR
jgi:hypothetical protein